jgi:hypothetical protein
VYLLINKLEKRHWFFSAFSSSLFSSFTKFDEWYFLSLFLFAFLSRFFFFCFCYCVQMQ